VRRAISTAAMGDLEDKRDVKLGHIWETESLLPGPVHFNPQYWPA